MSRYLFPIGIVLLALSICFYNTYRLGQENIQRKWDIAEAERNNKILEVSQKYDALQKDFSLYIENSRIILSKAENDYKSNLNSIIASHSNELRNSEERAKYYQRQAQNSNGECGSLADYAGRLDRTIVEGQTVVKELIESLTRKDAQIKFIGGILIEEQKLIIGD